jgi:PAS domain S-box-containing protein
VPQLRALAVFDAGGAIAAYTGQAPAGTNVADRDYFAVHRDRAHSSPYISAPFTSRVTGKTTLAVSRRIADAAGNFIGVAAGFFDVAYFSDFYRSLALGASGGARLFHRDGAVVAGDEVGPGAVFATTPGQRLIAPGTGAVLHVADVGTGQPGLVALRALRGEPLVLAVRSSNAHALAGWYKEAWTIGALGAAAAAIVLTFAFLVWRRLRINAQLRAEVRASGERLDVIVSSAMDAIVTVDSSQHVVLFNAAAERMFGCAAAQALGAPLEKFIPQRYRAAHHVHVERFGRTGETARRMGRRQALWGLRADGSEFPIEASISHSTAGGEHLFTVILRDISARLRAEEEIRHSHEQLRTLSAEMSEVREAERTRIARELHDELGQALTALKMDVDLLEGAIPPDRVALLERLTAMRGLLDHTVATTRRLSADLRPLVLDDLGLGAAAEWLAQNLKQRADIACDLSVDAICAELGEPHASAVFRIMQESLTNVARHAQARQVTVKLACEGDHVVLAVHDDGVGFDGQALAKPRSFGMRGIRERALALGGEVNVKSWPGEGTTVIVKIPLRGAAARAAA